MIPLHPRIVTIYYGWNDHWVAVGAPDAERVVVAMGSAAGALEETVEALNADGGRVGLVKVRLYRPLSAGDLVAALPATTKAVSRPATSRLVRACWTSY